MVKIHKINQEDEMIERIANSTNLEELLENLIEAELEHNATEENERNSMKFEDVCDLTSLPLFGGDEPAGTLGVWSWDKTRLLVGEGGFGNWKIVDRKNWE